MRGFVFLIVLAFLFTILPLSSEQSSEIKDSKEVRVKVVGSESAIVSYSVEERVVIKSGHWKNVKIAKFTNRMNETIVVTLLNSEVPESSNLRVIGGEVLVLEAGSTAYYSVGVIAENCSKSANVSFTFLAEWNGGFAKISTKSNPTLIEVRGNCCK